MSHFFLIAQMRMAQMRMSSNGNIFECDSNIYASHAFNHTILGTGCPKKNVAEKAKAYPSKSTVKSEGGRILTSL